MDPVFIFGSISGVIALVACVAIARNEYLYQMSRPSGEREPFCARCSQCMTSHSSCRERIHICRMFMLKCIVLCRFCQIQKRLFPDDNNEDESPQPDEKRNAPKPNPFPTVDIMFLVKRLTKEKTIDDIQAVRLAGYVAKQDPRLLALVAKHKRSNVQLTRNHDFRAALVVLARRLPIDDKVDADVESAT